jgi:hypothetical protein
MYQIYSILEHYMGENKRFASLLIRKGSIPRPLAGLLIAVFFLAAPVLFGQEGEYRIGEDGRFVQTLRWPDQDSVLYYRIEIEKQEGTEWEALADEETEAAVFELSLGPGIYRYRVWVHDILGRALEPADWIQFEVLLAKEPEISRFSPDGFYLDEDLTWDLRLSGRNLTAGIVIYLQHESLERRIQPQTITVEDREGEAHLVFHFGDLDLGSYTIHAVNPGGLAARVGSFKIAFRKPMDINVSAGYRPLVSLYGEINELFAAKFFPIGAYGRVSLIPFKRRWGYIGFELEPSWYYLQSEGSGYEARAHLAGGTINALYQWWLPNRVTALNFRLGGGMYAALNYRFTFDRGNSEPLTVLIPLVNAGASFQWFIKKPFFVEIGVDYTHFFSADENPPAYLRPFVGAGWQF